MLFTLILLTQTATATATATPTAKPVAKPTAIPRADAANSGLSGAASRVKLNKSVKFDDLRQAKPTPAYTPATPAGCDAGPFKGELLTYVSRFAGEAKTAHATPRIALAGQISRLRTLRAELAAASPKAPTCAEAVTGAALGWMDLEIMALDAFLGKEEGASQVYTEHALEELSRFDAERRVLK